MMSIREEKKELRKQMRTLRAGISPTDHTKYNLQVMDWFYKVCDMHDPSQSCDICTPSALFTYLDIEREVPTRGAIEVALLKGIPVFLPKTYPNGIMVFAEIFRLTDLSESRYHIPEPRILQNSTKVVGRPEWETVVSEDINGPVNYQSIFDDTYKNALMLVPGLAFSEDGYRLGYGGGYYDRYVRDVSFQTLAMTYDFQIQASVPTEEHDSKVDKMYIIKTL